MTTTYSTRTEAIEREIIEPLGAFAGDHDIDTIADEVLADYEHGYTLTVDEETFWQIVQRHAH